MSIGFMVLQWHPVDLIVFCLEKNTSNAVSTFTQSLLHMGSKLGFDWFIEKNKA